MRVRSSYKPYLDAVERYFDKLLPLVHDLQVETSTTCETSFYNLITARNEVGARQYFQKSVSRILSTGRGARRGGGCAWQGGHA